MYRRKVLRHILARSLVRFPTTSDSPFVRLVSKDLVTERRGAWTTKKMINLKAEVKERASTTFRSGVGGRGRSHNGEYRSERRRRPSLLVARWAKRCPRVTRSRVGLWRSKPRIGFLMSRKWLLWMVLVTDISHLSDLCVLLSQRIPGESTALSPLSRPHGVTNFYPTVAAAPPLSCPPPLWRSSAVDVCQSEVGGQRKRADR